MLALTLAIYAVGFIIAFVLAAREADYLYDAEDIITTVFIATIWPAIAVGLLVAALFHLARLGI